MDGAVAKTPPPEAEPSFYESSMQLFWETAGQFGESLVGTRGFEDHHPYSGTDIDGIVAAARQAGSDCLVTTDKDYMRLPQGRLPMDLMILGIAIQFKADRDPWREFIVGRVDALTSAHGVAPSP